MSEIVMREDKAEPKKVSVNQLRKTLQVFNEDLGQYINAEQRYRLGRVLTIIDASIADPEQRKAMKDLINSQWWGEPSIPIDKRMSNPHIELRGLAQALGFDLYEPLTSDVMPFGEGDHSEKVAQDKYSKAMNDN